MKENGQMRQNIIIIKIKVVLDATIKNVRVWLINNNV